MWHKVGGSVCGQPVVKVVFVVISWSEIHGIFYHGSGIFLFPHNVIINLNHHLFRVPHEGGDFLKLIVPDCTIW